MHAELDNNSNRGMGFFSFGFLPFLRDSRLSLLLQLIFVHTKDSLSLKLLLHVLLSLYQHFFIIIIIIIDVKFLSGTSSWVVCTLLLKLSTILRTTD